MELFEDSTTGGNAPEFTVSEISGVVKRVIEGEFGRVRVRGEVGRVYIARSGHLYFDIKDERSVLACVSWKGQVAGLSTRPEEGMEVIATGRMTTFGSQSKYQLNVEDVTPAGEGALMAMLEKRKKALAAEGLFDEARKKPLPLLPDVIGVVTSPTGAVIRDILHRLRERFPRKVVVWPVAVQGQACAPQVAAAIEGFNRLTPGGALPRPDLIIVARGGGSTEDLWGFNEEIVARAVAASDIPLISAVGHETDTTLIDYTADRRAPTPTAAAEMAVPVRMELQAFLDGHGARMAQRLSQAVEARGQRLRDLYRAMPRADALLAARRQRLDMGEARLPGLLERALGRGRQRLAAASARLSPKALRQHLRRSGLTLSQTAVRLLPALERQTALRVERLSRAGQDLRRALQQRLRQHRWSLDHRALSTAAAALRITDGRARVTALSERSTAAVPRALQERRQRVATLDRLRESMGYAETLRRGFAVVRVGGEVVRTAKEARSKPEIEVQFADGSVIAAPKERPPKMRRKPPEQGSLF